MDPSQKNFLGCHSDLLNMGKGYDSLHIETFKISLFLRLIQRSYFRSVGSKSLPQNYPAYRSLWGIQNGNVRVLLYVPFRLLPRLLLRKEQVSEERNFGKRNDGISRKHRARRGLHDCFLAPRAHD